MSLEKSNNLKPYWQSLEDLADTPEFRAFTKQEFPGFANIYESTGEAEVTGGFNRRQFISLSVAGLGLAGLAGCRRPDLQILPYARTTDENNRPLDTPVPGLPSFYATCQPRPGGCIPLIVESHEGRPTKIEGNPQHPASQGSTDAFAQASVLDIYSPDRSREVLNNGESKSWEDFDAFAVNYFSEVAKKQGEGFAILAKDLPSPSIRLVREHIKSVMPKATWYVHEPVDLVGPARQGTHIAFGQTLQPVYHFEKALRILSIDCDFLGIEDSVIPNSLGYATGRRGTDALHSHDHNISKKLNRLYVVENGFSITGSMADHRLRLPATNIADYAVAIAKEIGAKTSASWKASVDKAGASTIQIDRIWIEEVVKDLVEYKGKSLVVVGHRQPPLVHALAASINEALGNVGVTVDYRPVTEENNRSISDLASAMGKGEVKTLLILGSNPAYTAPADLEFSKQLAKVPTVIRLGLFTEPSDKKATWHLPMAHYLESWGDAETSDGHYCSIQPLIAPLYKGRSALELLIQLSSYEKASSYLIAQNKAYEVVQKAFTARSKKTEPIEFRRFLHTGFLADSAPAFVKPTIAATLGDAVGRWKPSQAVSESNMEVSFHPSYSVFDGRYSTNSWLMELPDPMTKLVWDNAAIISYKTSKLLSVKQGQLLKIEVGAKSIEVPAYILPGHADNSISLTLGYKGSKSIGHQQGGGGFDVYPIRTSVDLHFAPAKVTKITGFYELVTTQEHSTIPAERDEVVSEFTLSDYETLVLHKHGEPHGEEHENGERHGKGEGVHPEHHEDNPKLRFQYGYKVARELDEKKRISLDVSYPEKLLGHHQWGMVIDLNTCTGCSACVIACQSENNIPVVGKGEVKRNREMHWIRLDRYFTNVELNSNPMEPEGGFGDGIDDVRVVTEPMACQHCEGAPCESVCPVNAAVHSPEGLNIQVFNRCIGTRYCSNNCPYKVRRFNWFDFNQRQQDSLRVPTFLGQINSDEGLDTESLSPKGIPETLKMQKNPDVTVRMRGVMEKCTYCIQRLERGKIGAKVAAAKKNYLKPKTKEDAMAWGYDIRQIDGEAKIVSPDGLIHVACQQACPSQAIVFGNVNDTDSRVYQLKQREADFLVLGSRNTKPRTSYLPRLRNLNENMSKVVKKEAH
ncbi:TAT-variant-translocated molybdopterin oxidoreductase [Telmatocola sphagniphila]|uniref:TAT-variant-translocated molybdopterin oxidoreductase n=1 Tax=Telmatocola sphagniphila TaxID=1123043 RepID=A0A8E6EVZ6_9BACT|nr:TAT-variant-translocated molybdopterin oxidoreductase [Telmatocola sphagniphila]QVL33262.1 TAT-variant-translocated molybdopterin oxidoreductase [Telmatocola sphagniphila]